MQWPAQMLTAAKEQVSDVAGAGLTTGGVMLETSLATLWSTQHDTT